jgi:alkaline phosphatase D
MSPMNRRSFLQSALAVGATAAWAGSPLPAKLSPSKSTWTEHRDLFPEGVASGDPDASSVLLWTRRPYAADAAPATLRTEVATDPEFGHILATANVPVSASSDWTCRVLVGNLKPATVYWYRFTDSNGNGSRVGRTITAPSDKDDRPVRFAFVSCQNANQGAQNAYRRMIYEDERASEHDRLAFVLHLGDFIYELVWYPEDRPQGMYERRLRDIVRYEHGERISDFHIPTNVDDYRAVYRAYLHDPDIQDARARFPFVNMWDNHEFSSDGWQSLQKFDGTTRPMQTRKVAANQAFFEFQPARMVKSSGPSLDRFDAPAVSNAPITTFDEHGLGAEPNNLTALHSLTGYRALRFGKNIELIVTDQRSYRSEEPFSRPEAKAFDDADFPDFVPEELIEVLDAGRAYNNAPATIAWNGHHVPNFRRDAPPQTILGAEQKAWFLDRLRASTATWKIWGNTTATLDMRADMQHLPAGLTKPWPGAAYASCANGDHSSAFVERAEIYDFVHEHAITGFATVAGDRHSFWAGLSAKALPPKEFKPVGIAFVTGSISAPGYVEGNEYNFPKVHPLRALYLGQGPQDAKPQPTVNLLIRHGVRACLEYQASGNIEKARAASDPGLAPHLSFVDMGGHGYSVVRASSDSCETEFVCIPRPLERSTTEDGGPLAYRVRFHTPLWKAGESPKMQTHLIEGNPKFSIG